MVANDEATPEDIDNALMNGPGPRMAAQGQCMAFHVACGTGGMATNLDQFGPALKLPWTRLEAPELTKNLRDRMVDGCNAVAKGQKFEDMVCSARPRNCWSFKCPASSSPNMIFWGVTVQGIKKICKRTRPTGCRFLFRPSLPVI